MCISVCVYISYFGVVWCGMVWRGVAWHLCGGCLCGVAFMWWVFMWRGVYVAWCLCDMAVYSFYIG